MNTPILDVPVRWWHCPSCELVDRTQRADIHTQMHQCPALGGVCIPLIEVPDYDTRANGRQVLVEREDDIGDNLWAGPISSVRTERGDGSNDVTVFAPTAALKISN